MKYPLPWLSKIFKCPKETCYKIPKHNKQQAKFQLFQYFQLVKTIPHFWAPKKCTGPLTIRNHYLPKNQQVTFTLKFRMTLFWHIYTMLFLNSRKSWGLKNRLLLLSVNFQPTYGNIASFYDNEFLLRKLPQST